MFAAYQIFDYHYFSRLNPRLYDIVCNNVDHDVQGGGGITLMDLHTRGIKDVDILINWIEQLTPTVALNFAGLGEGGGPAGFHRHRFKIDECWGIHYNKGDQVYKHNHFPYSLSFCYCVTAPQGSSPLFIEGEEIDVVPGRIVFFLSHQYHGTYSSKVDGRSMIVGNILYTP